MTKEMIVLISSDGVPFPIDEAIALQSQTIAQMIEDGCDKNEVLLTNVTSYTLVNVIVYCKKHVEYVYEGPYSSRLLKEWDSEFMEIDRSKIFDIMLAADYLQHKDLLDLTTQTVSNLIQGKSPAEIRAFFKLGNDFTPQEQENIRKELPWLFD